MSGIKPTTLHIHFWADIRNSAGSVEKVISAFASHGEKYRHLIACCPTEPDVPASFSHHGVEVFTFRESRWANRVLNKILRLDAFTYHALVDLINRLRPDVLHFHNRQELVDAVVNRLAYRPGVLVHYHRHFRMPVIPACADRLLFISQRTAHDIIGKAGNGKPASIVFNPLSLEVLEHSRRLVASRLAGEPPVIVFGGGGNPIKGGAELLAAFKQLPAGMAKLVLAGRNVEKLCDNSPPGVEVLGEVPAAKFFELMQSADIVAMPSYDEPFGLIAQEAMLLGKLLIVSNSGGLTEFTGEDCAILVQPKDVESLRSGLDRALAILAEAARGSGSLTSMLAAARARVLQFSPPVVTRALEGAYDETRNESPALSK